MITAEDTLQRVNFAVCPYDGTNLRAIGRPPSLAGPPPMRCPECGRRFELAEGKITEPPPDTVEDDSKP
jgi:hypothetical protein